MSANITSMDDFFNVKYIRQELIQTLKEHGMPKQEIQNFIFECDRQYKTNKVPYPMPNELIF
ncbi:MAG: hypothetical protein IJO08_03175 [Clostridia bacterium]|nr:hypothetical protein [Clostridia bacterium]